jgi:excisionase family DNA binding protein
MAANPTHLPGLEAPRAGKEAQKPKEMAEPLQVTIREAARLLSYAERTIRRLVARGELRAIGRGRMRRIALEDLHAWQRRNRC